MTINLEQFITAYIACALWSSTDDNGEPMDKLFTVDAFHPDSVAEMRRDCGDFVEGNNDLFSEILVTWYSSESAGHDFWLTRNRHGAGFWDRGLGKLGALLTEAAKVYGSSDLYVGDDGKVHAS